MSEEDLEKRMQLAGERLYKAAKDRDDKRRSDEQKRLRESRRARPRLNDRSQRIVTAKSRRLARERTGGSPAHERLYQEGKALTTKRHSLDHNLAGERPEEATFAPAINERSRQFAEALGPRDRCLLLHSDGERFAKNRRARAMQFALQEAEETTLSPAVNRKSREYAARVHGAAPAFDRLFADAQRKHFEQVEATHRPLDEAEYSFTPAITARSRALAAATDRSAGGTSRAERLYKHGTLMQQLRHRAERNTGGHEPEAELRQVRSRPTINPRPGEEEPAGGPVYERLYQNAVLLQQAKEAWSQGLTTASLAERSPPGQGGGRAGGHTLERHSMLTTVGGRVSEAHQAPLSPEEIFARPVAVEKTKPSMLLRGASMRRLEEKQQAAHAGAESQRLFRRSMRLSPPKAGAGGEELAARLEGASLGPHPEEVQQQDAEEESVRVVEDDGQLSLRSLGEEHSEHAIAGGGEQLSPRAAAGAAGESGRDDSGGFDDPLDPSETVPLPDGARVRMI